MKSPVQSFFNIEKTIASESAYRDYSTKHNQTREQLKFRRFGGPASKRARAAARKYQPAATSATRRQLMKPRPFRRFRLFRLHRENLRCGRPLAAFFHHGLDILGLAAEEGFDAAVKTITHPSRKGVGARLFDRPSPIPHPLHPAFDADAEGDDIRHVSSPNYSANSMIFWSTIRLSPALEWTLPMVPSRSARRMFSIFIASTTQSTSPALIS